MEGQTATQISGGARQTDRHSERLLPFWPKADEHKQLRNTKLLSCHRHRNQRGSQRTHFPLGLPSPGYVHTSKSSSKAALRCCYGEKFPYVQWQTANRSLGFFFAWFSIQPTEALTGNVFAV